MPLNGKYRTWEVARETGATLRQLQYWDEQLLFVPHRKLQHLRLYSKRQVELVKFVVQLVSYGVRSSEAAFELARIANQFKWNKRAMLVWVMRLKEYINDRRKES